MMRTNGAVRDRLAGLMMALALVAATARAQVDYGRGMLDPEAVVRAASYNFV